MSGECEICSEHCLECKCTSTADCKPYSRRQENGGHYSWKVAMEEFERFKQIKLNQKVVTLSDGLNPPAEQIPTKWVNVKGREEHEAILKSSEKCKELGLDQYYEIMVYLNRWGNWLDTPPENPQLKP